MAVFLLVIYLVVLWFWAIIAGLDFWEYRTRSSAINFLKSFVWPLVILHLVFQAVRVALDKDD